MNLTAFKLSRAAIPAMATSGGAIVDTMLYLASAQARYVTGAVLEVIGAKAVH